MKILGRGQRKTKNKYSFAVAIITNDVVLFKMLAVYLLASFVFFDL
jgi:hypothetical protein